MTAKAFVTSSKHKWKCLRTATPLLFPSHLRMFFEMKANDFGVTVMRKGELQLHVDQTLEEVEEQITEIGSKIYHDKIMQERSMDRFRHLFKYVTVMESQRSQRRKRYATVKD